MDLNATVFTYFTELQPVPLTQSILELTIYVAAFVSGILGNTALILAVALDNRLHTASNYLIANQATSDILYVLSTIPWVVNRWKGTWTAGDGVCKACVYVQYVSSTVSIWNMCGISVERLRSIERKRASAMTKLQVTAFVTVLWGIALCSSGVMIAGSGVQLVEAKDENLTYCSVSFPLLTITDESRKAVYALCAVTFLGPVLFLVCVYTKIIVKVHGSFERMRTHLRHELNLRKMKLERRLVKMLVLSALFFFVMWSPSMVTNVLILARHYHLLTPTLIVCVTTICTINMSVNPMLMLGFNSFFRDDLKRALRFSCCQLPGRRYFCCIRATSRRRYVLPDISVPLQGRGGVERAEVLGSRCMHIDQVRTDSDEGQRSEAERDPVGAGHQDSLRKLVCSLDHSSSMKETSDTLSMTALTDSTMAIHRDLIASADDLLGVISDDMTQNKTSNQCVWTLQVPLDVKRVTAFERSRPDISLLEDTV